MAIGLAMCWIQHMNDAALAEENARLRARLAETEAALAEAIEPSEPALHDPVVPVRLSLLSTPRRAMRGVTEQARHSARQRRWS
jgi:hypothetical protein